VRRAQQSGMRADEFAQQIVNAGQLGALMSDILRGKALALVMERAKISDTSGREVDLNALSAPAPEELDDLDDLALTEIDATSEGDLSDDTDFSDDAIDDELGDAAAADDDE
jgi:trigger factor